MSAASTPGALHGPFDLLRVPVIGRILRWRWGRLVLQIPFLLIALLLVYDGLTGDARAPRNLSTVVSWVHYRGFLVLALLLVGNLFCMGCPFTIPRTLAKRLSSRGRRFPRILRTKWIAIGALFVLFFLYEWLDLWASPALTAWLIIAYFVASFVLEAVFAESPFCKYVCPLGSFNFVYSSVSPLQIGIKSPDTCATCVGKECVNGSYSAQPVVLIDAIGVNGAPDQTHAHTPRGTLGCGTELFAPQMHSNMDCVFCLDCARACPHDNIGLFNRGYGAELSRKRVWNGRLDVSLLVIALAFLGLINAFGMTPPVYTLIDAFGSSLGLTAAGWSEAAITALALACIFIIGAGLIPALASFAAAAAARALTGTVRRDTLRSALTTFAPIFVPIGLGFWIAHYGFHVLTGLGTIVPAAQQFLLDHGIGLLGAPNWAVGTALPLELIGLLQAVALFAGFGFSLLLAQRIAFRTYRQQGALGLLPWALLLVLMMLIGFWLINQPMEMRGMDILG